MLPAYREGSTWINDPDSFRVCQRARIPKKYTRLISRWSFVRSCRNDRYHSSCFKRDDNSVGASASRKLKIFYIRFSDKREKPLPSIISMIPKIQAWRRTLKLKAFAKETECPDVQQRDAINISVSWRFLSRLSSAERNHSVARATLICVASWIILRLRFICAGTFNSSRINGLPPLVCWFNRSSQIISPTTINVLMPELCLSTWNSKNVSH